jgi:hypothetical protein
MRSGWPHTGDGQGMTPANQRGATFGPDVSWPSGGYSQGSHPYAAFNGAGYGDGGYSDPGYQGPAAQDAGIAGTRTVRGFVESGQRQTGYTYSPEAGYAQSGYEQPGYEQPGYGQPGEHVYGQPGYAGSSYAAGGQVEMAYPQPAGSRQDGGNRYSQPWDYDQPLRYDGDDDTYQAVDSYAFGQQDNGAVRYQPPAYDPAAYNGSDYSMPGINGPGYDLSGIIGTSDFEAIGYDEPSYGRLSYDDPRYDDRQRYSGPPNSGPPNSGPPNSGPLARFDETRFDVPRYDDTRLDNLWLPGSDARRELGPAGYGNDGFGNTRPRSEPPAAFSGRGARSAETRYDMRALVEPGDSTRFDVPRYDETRIDNLRALTPGRGLRASGTAVLAPPAGRPRGWAEDTSLDHFADLDLTDEPVPGAFTRTLERPQQDEDAAARRAVGRRRGRNGDRKQWIALTAIAVLAAGALGGVLHYVLGGPSGPAHQVAAPQAADGFTRSANLEKQLGVAAEAAKVKQASGGKASDVVSAVYQQGSITAGSNTQIFMFVGGKLAGADPGASVDNFEKSYPGAVAVSPGSLGGQAACTETHLNGQSASMCVWFDNDTFGTVVSPTMTTAKLAATMDAARPSLELYAK